MQRGIFAQRGMFALYEARQAIALHCCGAARAEARRCWMGSCKRVGDGRCRDAACGGGARGDESVRKAARLRKNMHADAASGRAVRSAAGAGGPWRDGRGGGDWFVWRRQGLRDAFKCGLVGARRAVCEGHAATISHVHSTLPWSAELYTFKLKIG